MARTARIEVSLSDKDQAALVAEVRNLQAAVRWLVEDAYPDEVYRETSAPDGDIVELNPREDMLTRMAEDDDLDHDDGEETVDWPDHTPALAALTRAMAAV
jgi:hypothetical protein